MPVLVTIEVVPDIALPPLSDRLVVQLPVNKLLSSPFKVAVIVNMKFIDGVVVVEARVIEYM